MHDLLLRADQQMRDGDPRGAQAVYQQAWQALQPGALPPEQRVWLLIAIAWASVRAGDYEEAFDACSAALQHFGESGVVVGNPLFHLIVGLAYAGLGENDEGRIDNLTRALICGGPEIFDGEDPQHFAAVTQVLRPPEGYASWDDARGGYDGCSRDLLNGARGYLAELLTTKLGAPPPYEYDDDED